MTSTIIAPSRVHGHPAATWVAFSDGMIAEIGGGRLPAAAVEVSGTVLVPGFLDLQVNGIDDVNFGRTDAGGWRRAGRALITHGVTGYCPTLVSSPLEDYAAPLALAAEAQASEAHEGPDRASILGVHLEGPFLGGMPGAHQKDRLLEADVAWLSDTLASHPGLVRIVTLGPEADPGFAAIGLLAGAHVVASIGHSAASYDLARAAADAGARSVTHLFNAMKPLHHRDPGLVGAALDDDRLTPGVIADLIHVHPAALRVVFARKPNVALVSDSVGIKAPELAEMKIAYVDGAPRLADGTLAGSTLTLDVAVRNVVSLGVPLERAVDMATRVPADLIGAHDRGRLDPGARADLVLLDSRELTVRAVWLGGHLVFGSPHS